MNTPKNILIVRTDRIGDVVLSLPLASIIKKHFPSAKVTFLLRNYTAPLAANNPDIDDVIILKENGGKSGIKENVNMLKNKFDICVTAFPTFRIALILFLSKIKTRVGSGYRWYSFLFNKKVYEHRKFAEHHELEFNVRLLKQIGIDENVNRGNVEFKLTPLPERIKVIEKDFKSLGIDEKKKIIIVHPGSGGSSVDLPSDMLKELIEKISSDPGLEILITGSNAEAELCQQLVVNGRTKNLAGKYELPELIALIDKADLMIANSTGPVHIAAALGKYVVGFYPHIVSCSEERWGPYTNKKNIFKPAVQSRQKNKEDYRRENLMRTINVDEVWESVKSILPGTGSEKK
ncbi:MAG: glycosyltransferase family 9 protein [Ignavibacteriales bacterium]|nr:glycosyltransferase family 9 protein [Ignavibacteriales bacterium]